jgi:O-antigen/teichoic acid export membrane protein
VSSSAAKVARGSLILLLGNTLKVPITLVAIAYMTRLLSLAELGTVMGLGVLVSLFQLCTDPGFSKALTTFCAEAIGKRKNARGLIAKVTVVGTGLSFTAATAVFLSAGSLTALLPELALSSHLVQFVAIDIFLSSLGPYMDGILVGMSDFRAITYSGISSHAIMQFSGLFFITIGMGPLGVVLGWILGDSASLIFTFFLVLRDFGIHASLSPFSFDIRSLLAFALPLYGIDLIGFLAGSFDTLYVLAAFSAEQLAIYAVALSIYTGISGLPTIVSSVLLPHFSEQYARVGTQMLQNEARDAARYICLIFLPTYLGLAAVAKPALALYAGPSYSEGAFVLMVLCVLGALTLFSSGFGQVFYVLKKTRLLAYIAAAATAVGIALALALAQPLGILGVAIARGVGSITMALLLWQGLRKLLSVRLNLSSLAKVLLTSLIMFFAVYIVQMMYYSSYLLGAYVAIGIVAYVAFSRKFHVFRTRDFMVTRELVGSRLAPLVGYAEKVIGGDRA